MRTKWLVVVALVATVGAGVTYAQNYPPGVTVVKVYAQPASSPCFAQGGESAAIADGALTVVTNNTVATQAAPQSIPTPTGLTYGFQNQAPQPVTCQSTPFPQEKVIVIEKRKRHWWNIFSRCGASVSAMVVVDGGLPPAHTYGSYWVENNSAYDAYYYGGHNQVFSWGHPSYSTVSYNSHTFVDDYHSGPYPPVWFVPDAAREGHPRTSPTHGGGGSPSPGPRPNPPHPRGGGGRPPGHR